MYGRRCHIKGGLILQRGILFDKGLQCFVGLVNRFHYIDFWHSNCFVCYLGNYPYTLDMLEVEFVTLAVGIYKHILNVRYLSKR